MDILRPVTFASIIASLKKIFCTHGLPQSPHLTAVPEYHQPNCYSTERSDERSLNDSVARDRDAEMKQKRTDYAGERRGAQENSVVPGDQVMVKQKKESCQPLLRIPLTRSPINMTMKSHSNIT